MKESRGQRRELKCVTDAELLRRPVSSTCKRALAPLGSPVSPPRSPLGHPLLDGFSTPPIGAKEANGSKLQMRWAEERKHRCEEVGRKQGEVLAKANSFAELQYRKLEVTAERAEERLVRAEELVEARKMKQVTPHRAALWVQMMCTVLPVSSLYRMEQRRRALVRLQFILIPVLRLWRHRVARRRERIQYTSERIEGMRRPTVDSLLRIPFFEGWGAAPLRIICDGVVASCHRAGTHVCMEGDWGKEMYIIASGTVDIVIRNRESQNTKSRAKKDGIVVASLSSSSPKPVVGEFAVLCDEPRSASVIAATPVDLWAISQEVFSKALQHLDVDLRNKLYRLIHERREVNMLEMHPVTAEQLRSSHPLFHDWPESLVVSLCKKFVPRVCPAQRLITQGGQANQLYLLRAGTATIRRHIDELHEGDSAESGREEVVAEVGPGALLGEVACLFCETRCASVDLDCVCELWMLSKDDFSAVLMASPALLLRCKEVVNNVRAKWLAPCPRKIWKSCPALASVSPPARFFSSLMTNLTAQVLHSTSLLVTRGDPIVSICCIVGGRAVDPKLGKEYGKGDIIGVPEVLTQQDMWSYTVKAVTRCDLWICPASAFLHLLHKHGCLAAVDAKMHTALLTQHNLPHRPYTPPAPLSPTPVEPRLLSGHPIPPV